MTKSLFKTFVFLVLFAGLATMTFAAQIILWNGKVLDGPIVSVTPTSVTIKDAVLGEITTPRVEILRAVPPLDEGRPALPAQVSGLGQPIAASVPKKGGLQFGFNLGGGLSNINGGDFNQIIRDMNAFCSDWNAHYGEQNYTIDWNEMKWLSNFRAELFLRIGPYFGIGLGAEYMKKTNPGSINYSFSYSQRFNHTGYYYIDSYTQNEPITHNQTMTVIPLTLNLYGFLPLSNKIEFYVNLGPGIYFGTVEGTYTRTDTEIVKEVWYLSSGSLWPPHYYDEYDYSTSSQYKATNSVFGFHFGGGFNFKLSSAVSLYVEGFYRIANFNNWQGDTSWSWTERYNWGWTNNPDGPGPYTATNSGSGGVTGKIWYWEDYYSYLAARYYGQYDFFAAGDEPTWGHNYRQAEFNINGFSFRIGFKIGFDLN